MNSNIVVPLMGALAGLGVIAKRVARRQPRAAGWQCRICGKCYNAVGKFIPFNPAAERRANCPKCQVALDAAMAPVSNHTSPSQAIHLSQPGSRQ